MCFPAFFQLVLKLSSASTLAGSAAEQQEQEVMLQFFWVKSVVQFFLTGVQKEKEKKQRTGAFYALKHRQQHPVNGSSVFI